MLQDHGGLGRVAMALDIAGGLKSSGSKIREVSAMLGRPVAKEDWG